MRFNLVRYFTVASLVAFALVAAAMMFFERSQADFFKQVQTDQVALFDQVQTNFVKQQENASTRDLLAIHENGNVNLTRLFANSLWERDFAPFVAVVSQIPVDHCRAIADVKDEKTGKMVAPADKKACFTEVGKQIMATPGFKELDTKVFNSMKKSTVFKIKVFDLRGITVYSSEHAQIGEDKAFNKGWQSAANEGKPASELTHRDKFSAFEGVVENRDVIGSYLPVLGPGTDKIVGVFEVYSDVTQFLAQIKTTATGIKKAAADTQTKVQAAAEENQAAVESSSWTSILIVAALLAGLFGALFVVVRRAQALLEQQEKEREHAQQQLAQSEKMASLGQMVAGVAHQLNTPLAFSQSNVQMVQQALGEMGLSMKVAEKMSEIIRKADGDQVVLNIAKAKETIDDLEAANVDVSMLQQMLGDVLQGIEQMTELVVNLRDFTRLDRAKMSEANLNKSLHTVIYIAKSVISNAITVEENFGDLPSVECNPSQLNQVFLNLINNAAHAIPSSGGTIKVRTFVEGDQVKIEVADSGSGIPADVLPHIFELYYTTKPEGEGTGLGLPIARDIVQQHGGDMTVKTAPGEGTTFTISLPIRQALVKAA